MYTRSDRSYPHVLPCTRDYGRKGIVFCAYQALGTNPFDLVVCYHLYKNTDRERKELYSFNVIDVFADVVYYVDAQGAMRILEKMRRYWNSVPTCRIDIHSWYPVISSLVNKISRNSEAQNAFRTKYPNLLYLPTIYTIHDKNQRSQARSWLRSQSEQYLLVQRAFKALGYPSLEEACEQAGGFVKDANPSELEQACFQMLHTMISCIFSDFFCFEKTPTPMIIRNQTASWHGMATLDRYKGKKENPYGIRIRYTVREIYLAEDCFRKDGFYNALSTYVHESCHMFGGDSSRSFSFALTLAMEQMILFGESISTFKAKWEALFESA